MSCRLSAAALALTLFASAGCELPQFQGPQIQNAPGNFVMQPETFLQRRMFPDRELAFHTAWVHTDVSGISLIYVNGHQGAVTVDDVIRARDGVMAATRDPDTKFSEIEPVTIDDRRGWGWSERVESPSRGLVDVAYRAVVPYDTISYAIEFTSGEPNLKRTAPDTLRAVVSSFAVGKTEWNLPLIVVLVGLGLFAVNTLKKRAQERKDRLSSIHFVKIEQPEEGDEAEPSKEVPVGAGASQGSAPTGGSPPPPPVMPSGE